MEPTPTDFTDEERHVLEYFRPWAASKWRRGAIFDLTIIIISLALGAAYLVYRDPGAGFVAYGLLLWRAWAAFWHRRRYAKVYRSIFSKYEARVQELGRTSAGHAKA